jgi:hypothetical protein
MDGGDDDEDAEAKGTSVRGGCCMEDHGSFSVAAGPR